MDYQSFKNELENYYTYKKDVMIIDEDIDNLLYEMTGVKGVRYDKTPISANPSLAHERLLEMIEKLHWKEKEKRRLELNIQYIEDKLSMLSDEDKKICLDLIAKKGNSILISSDHGYSKSGVWARVKREIKKILRN